MFAARGRRDGVFLAMRYAAFRRLRYWEIARRTITAMGSSSASASASSRALVDSSSLTPIWLGFVVRIANRDNSPGAKQCQAQNGCDLVGNAIRLETVGVYRKKTTQVGIRMCELLRARVDAAAARDGRKTSDWLRICAEEKLASGEPVKPPVPAIAQDVIRYGAWLTEMPHEIMEKLLEIGEALKMLYGSKLHGRGTLPLGPGTARNTLTEAGKTRSNAKRTVRKRKRRGRPGG